MLLGGYRGTRLWHRH